ncbi:MAG TPA: hypothetical protein VFW27_29750 [Actinoplanes sp.]|nr:hypothetical protein [Actinoplanes sp.]
MIDSSEYGHRVALPISKQQFNRLGERIAAGDPPAREDLTQLNQVLRAYQAILDTVEEQLAGIGLDRVRGPRGHQVRHYLVVFDRRSGAVVRFQEFSNADDALTARFDAENEYADNADIEVVVLGASSKDSLLKTHARYFKGTLEIASSALTRLRRFEAASQARVA